MHNKYWHQVFPGKRRGGFHWIQFAYRVKSSFSLEVAMSLPEFRVAKVDHMQNGVLRIRGKELDSSHAGKMAFQLFFGFGCFASAFSFFTSYSESGFDDLYYLLQSAALPLVFFTLMGFIPYFLLTHGIHLIRVVSGHHKLWWDDFTFDGETVKSRRFRFKASDIASVEPGIKKFPDLDSWYYASVVDSDGIEIGRVMVVRSDRKKMVSYLSELFGVS